MDEAFFKRIASIVVRRLEELDANASSEERITTINAALSIATMEKAESAAVRQMAFQREMMPPSAAAAPGLFFGAKVTDLEGKEVTLDELPPQLQELFKRFRDGTPGSNPHGA